MAHSQRIRVLSQPLVYVASTRIGRGVFAHDTLETNNVIGKVEGQLVDDPEFESAYGIDMGGDLTLVPHFPFRYLNHSCNPNAELVDVDGYQHGSDSLVVVAVRQVAADEEITIDYGWPIEAAEPCHCQSPGCRGIIGAPIAHNNFELPRFE